MAALGVTADGAGGREDAQVPAHLLEHDHGSYATPQAAQDGPSQTQNTGAKPASSLVWWFGVKAPCFSALKSVLLSSFPFSPL